MVQPQVGERVSEYILDEQVGQGSFGQVWKAHHHIWQDQFVAVKIPTDPGYVRNLQREGVTIHGLKHPNIVRAMGLDPYAEVPYLVMEFVDGCSLMQLIQTRPDGLPIPTVRSIVCGILRGLEHAHARGVIHRDLKPANILIIGGDKKRLEEITEDDVKVTDFGLGEARQITTASIVQSGSLLTEEGKSISGTLAYMAPEQRDQGRTDVRSDLYAVGVLLFEMLCGQRPSGSDMPSHVRTGVPAWVDAVYSRLYTRYERRFASPTEVLNSIAVSNAPPVVHPGRTAAPRLAPEQGGTRVASSTGATCPSCRTAVDAGDNFCIACGALVGSSVRRCLACGAYPEPDDRFCIMCGTAFANATT